MRVSTTGATLVSTTEDGAFTIDDEDDDENDNEESREDRKQPLSGYGIIKEKQDSFVGRTIDIFLEEAYESILDLEEDVGFKRWRYYGMVLILGSVNTVNAVLYSNTMYLLADESFQNDILNNDDATKGAILSGILLAGMILGGLIAPFLGGGRKSLIVLGLLTNLFGSIVMAATSSYEGLLVGRLMAGVGTGFNLPAVTALTTELSPPSQRGALVAIVDSHWTLGAIVLGIIGLGVFGFFQASWRVFLLCCSFVPLVSLLFVICFVVESPRHLALQGRYNEASDSVNIVAGRLGYSPEDGEVDGDDEEPLTKTPTTNGHEQEEQQLHFPTTPRRLTPQEIQHHFEAQKRLSRSVSSPSTLQQTKMLFQGRQRRNTLMLLVLWVCLSSVGSLGMWLTSLLEEVHIQHVYFSTLLTALAAVPGNALAIWLLDRIGRTKVFLVAMTLTAVTLAYFALLARNSGDDIKPVQIVICASLYNSLLSCGWNAVMVMSGELFATQLRYAGFALCATAGRVCSFSSQFWNGALMEQPSAQLLVACVIACTGALATLICAADDLTRHSVDDVVGCSSAKDRTDDAEGDQIEFVKLPQVA